MLREFMATNDENLEGVGQDADLAYLNVRLDQAMLRALAHPLRLRLLIALRLRGPNTASGLARELDTNSGHTSYHLRLLAQVGLIEDDEAHSTARDRYWRASHQGMSWAVPAFWDDPDDRAAETVLRGQLVRTHMRWVDQALEARGGWKPAWHDNATAMSDWSMPLRPESCRAMLEELRAVLAKYHELDEVDAPDAEDVTVLLYAFPNPEPVV